MGLLGQGYDPYGGMSSLLGVDTKAMRNQALWNGLAAAGFSLMGSKDLGRAGGAFLVGTNQARDDYMNAALDAYRLKSAEEDRAYRRQQDEENDAWRQKEWDYNVARQNKADAWTNTERQRQMDEWQRQDDQRAAAEGAWDNLRTMPSTGIPVQNYGMADQLWKMGKENEALGLILPQQQGDLPNSYEEYLRAQKDPAYGQFLAAQKRAGATQVDINGGGTDKQIFDETKARAEAARSAFMGLNALGQAEQALPGAITGAAANQRLALQKVAALFGVGDTEAIVDTETFRAAIAPQVAAMLKATTGTTQVSNSDREFAEKAAAGSIELDGQAIGRLINIMQAMSSETVRAFNADLNTVYPEGQGFDRERALFGVPNVPKMYAAPIGPRMPGQQQQGRTVDPSNPKPGDVVLGYRFKGGDRRDPRNWEKVE